MADTASERTTKRTRFLLGDTSPSAEAIISWKKQEKTRNLFIFCECGSNINSTIRVWNILLFVSGNPHYGHRCMQYIVASNTNSTTSPMRCWIWKHWRSSSGMKIFYLFAHSYVSISKWRKYQLEILKHTIPILNANVGKSASRCGCGARPSSTNVWTSKVRERKHSIYIPTNKLYFTWII